MKHHPLSRYFPMLPEEEFEELKASIRDHGLREAITLLDGKILDGRNRYKACLEVGVEPRFEEYKKGEDEALDFVVDMNMRRRHLMPDQKAQIIIDIEGKPEPAKPDRGHGSTTVKPGVPTYTDLARKAGVSVPTVKRVATVQDDDELKEQLRSGETSARAAEREYERKVVEKGAKPKQDFYKMSAEVASTITWLRDIIRRDWESGLRMGKVDVKGHVPRLIKYIDEAIERLEKFKAALEEAYDGP